MISLNKFGIVIVFAVLGLIMFSFGSPDFLTGYSSFECTDTDEFNGISSVFHSGATKSRNFGSWRTDADLCVGNVLVETYCNNGVSVKGAVKCTYGCYKNKCNPFRCDDSDGTNYRTKGITTGLGEGDADLLGTPPSVQSKSYFDYCTSEKMGVEYYCGGNRVVSETFSCGSFRKDYVCADGRCVKG